MLIFIFFKVPLFCDTKRVFFSNKITCFLLEFHFIRNHIRTMSITATWTMHQPMFAYHSVNSMHNAPTFLCCPTLRSSRCRGCSVHWTDDPFSQRIHGLSMWHLWRSLLQSTIVDRMWSCKYEFSYRLISMQWMWNETAKKHWSKRCVTG